MSIEAVMALVKSYRCRLVEITGGEPLLQDDEVNSLIKFLLENRHDVLLETNGSISIKNVNQRVIKIVDLKCPDSGMSEHIYWKNLEYLTEHDQVKFVLSSRRDYEWARDIIKKIFPCKIEILLSTVFGLLNSADVVKWMLEDSINARFQLQIHKYIWHPDTKGV
jgi:7-carboxy-7-deazaguanine synthase